MNDEFESPLDKIIREARQRGEFNNLPGAGRPLRWEDEGLTPDDQRIANHVLRSNGFVPEWLAAAEELKKQYQAAREKLERARTARAEGRLDARGWESAREAYAEAVRKINLSLVGVNMRAPHDSAHLPPFPMDVE